MGRLKKRYSFRAKNPIYASFLSTCPASDSPLLLLLEEEPAVERCELRHGPGLQTAAADWWIDCYVLADSGWSPFSFRDRIQTLMMAMHHFPEELLGDQIPGFGLDSLFLEHRGGAFLGSFRASFEERATHWLGSLLERFPPLLGTSWRYITSRFMWALLMRRIGKAVPNPPVFPQGHVLTKMTGPSAENGPACTEKELLFPPDDILIADVFQLFPCSEP